MIDASLNSQVRILDHQTNSDQQHSKFKLKSQETKYNPNAS